ncbi:hypothetical protein JTL93_38815, partial [Pseudomonas aeruginosa]|nr:hypothetical protein [Pseudomonas aeruginosa]
AKLYCYTKFRKFDLKHENPHLPPHEGGFALPLTARRFIAWVWPGLFALSVGPAWVTYIEEN